MDDFITKPPAIQTLAKVIKRWVSEPAAATPESETETATGMPDSDLEATTPELRSPLAPPREALKTLVDS
jgi:FixJ family two-component response regulator